MDRLIRSLEEAPPIITNHPTSGCGNPSPARGNFRAKKRFDPPRQCAEASHRYLTGLYDKISQILGSNYNIILLDLANITISNRMKPTSFVSRYNNKQNFYILFSFSKTNDIRITSYDLYGNTAIKIFVPCIINEKQCKIAGKGYKNESDDMALVLAHDYLNLLGISTYIYSGDRYCEWLHNWENLNRVQIHGKYFRRVKFDTKLPYTNNVYDPNILLRPGHKQINRLKNVCASPKLNKSTQSSRSAQSSRSSQSTRSSQSSRSSQSTRSTQSSRSITRQFSDSLRSTR